VQTVVSFLATSFLYVCILKNVAMCLCKAAHAGTGRSSMQFYLCRVIPMIFSCRFGNGPSEKGPYLLWGPGGEKNAQKACATASKAHRRGLKRHSF
jgi:hypothetical protein